VAPPSFLSWWRQLFFHQGLRGLVIKLLLGCVPDSYHVFSSLDCGPCGYEWEICIGSVHNSVRWFHQSMLLLFVRFLYRYLLLLVVEYNWLLLLFVLWKIEAKFSNTIIVFLLGRVGRVMWKADTSKVVALSVSVKDRWVGPCEQVLNVLITCWRYEPSWCNLSSIDDWL
jgi:hypothetical protein